MDRQPVLDGELLRLRPLHEPDREALYAVARDPLIWAQHPVPERHTRASFDAFFDDSLASGGALLAIENATDAVIGSSRYHGFDPARSEVEIGWSFLARRCWGGRFNGEMKRLMVAHALGSVERVVFLVAPSNVRSARAMEKVGGRPAGTRRDAGGRESVVYEITRG